MRFLNAGERAGGGELPVVLLAEASTTA